VYDDGRLCCRAAVVKFAVMVGAMFIRHIGLMMGVVETVNYADVAPNVILSALISCICVA